MEKYFKNQLGNFIFIILLILVAETLIPVAIILKETNNVLVAEIIIHISVGILLILLSMVVIIRLATKIIVKLLYKNFEMLNKLTEMYAVYPHYKRSNQQVIYYKDKDLIISESGDDILEDSVFDIPNNFIVYLKKRDV